jgi:hypothetical protein
VKNKATIEKKALSNDLSVEDLMKLKQKLTKDEMLITALAFGHCVLQMYKAAQLEMPMEFSSIKEARRLVRALRKQGKDSV